VGLATAACLARFGIESVVIEKNCSAGEDVWRIDYQLHEQDDAVLELRAQRVRARVPRHLDFIGERAAWELIWTFVYSASSLALESYIHEHVLFAGDAAHLVPIFGVRGLNSGFADAHNLAWKLARVLHGNADGALLQTYACERRAATLEIHRQAEKTTRFMTPTTRGDILMRDAALSLAADHQFVRPLVDPRQSVPYSYHDSNLNSFSGQESSAGFRDGPSPSAPLRNLRVRIKVRLLGLPDLSLLRLLHEPRRCAAAVLAAYSARACSAGRWC
jgi:3-(3-hydroxy-phenyl)propionate hydroxylase